MLGRGRLGWVLGGHRAGRLRSLGWVAVDMGPAWRWSLGWVALDVWPAACGEHSSVLAKTCAQSHAP